MTARRSAVTYYLAQAAVGAFFWFLVRGSEEGRRLFDLLPGQPRVTDAFLWADVVAILTSLATAWAVEHDLSWAGLVAAFTAGCLVYPTVYLVAWAPSSAGGARCLLIMVPPSLISTWLAREVSKGLP